MRTQVCEMLGIEFPILAFSHCRDVVAAVSKAGASACSVPPLLHPISSTSSSSGSRIYVDHVYV